MTKLTASLNQLAKQLNIKVPSESQLSDIYLPVSRQIHQRADAKPGVIIGVSGTQGSGKSTFCNIIKLILQETHNKNAVVISLDDFYKTKAERVQMARDVHPLFKMRGVPGTHDVGLAMAILLQLKTMTDNKPVTIPIFDKAIDDRSNQNDWQNIEKKPDVILFEGWCLGAKPQKELDLKDPINQLEETEDIDGHFRKAVNDFLKRDYQQLFSLIDMLIMIEVPSFDVVYQNRLEQEKKLAEKTGKMAMSPAELKRFVQLYQRLSEHMLKEMPERAELVLRLIDGPNYEIRL